jgi:hypothetical protein
MSNASNLLEKALKKVNSESVAERMQRQKLLLEKEKSTVLKFKQGFTYLDFTNIPDVGDQKKFKGFESGVFIGGGVKNAGEIRVKLKNGHEITTSAEAVDNLPVDDTLRIAGTLFGS